MNLKRRTLSVRLAAAGAIAGVVAIVGAGMQLPAPDAAAPAARSLPDKDFDRRPKRTHSPDDYYFKLDQLEHFYRAPGEYGHRLRGDEYGFDALSFIITETHPGGGPNLHKHDVEEAHVLLEGTAQYQIGDQTFTVAGPYIARVPAGVPHTFLNVGTKPFQLTAVFASKRHRSERLGPNPLLRVAPKK